MKHAIPRGALIAWYCPALGAFHRPTEPLAEDRRHLFERFEWLALYARSTPVDGLVLRAYHSPSDDAFYASHRTMSEKVAQQPGLVELYALPGAYGNDNAGHVPPKM